MDLREQMQQMKEHAGGGAFINQAQLCRYLNVGKSAARELLAGLPFYATGRERKYAIRDVAKEIQARMVEVQ